MKIHKWPTEYISPKALTVIPDQDDEKLVNSWCDNCTKLDAIALFLFIQVDSSVFAFFGGIVTNFFAAALITIATQKIDFMTTKSLLQFGIAVMDFLVQMILIGLIIRYTLCHIRISKKINEITTDKDISGTMKRYKQISTCLPMLDAGKASILGTIALLAIFLILKIGTFYITNYL